jgi:hypothetical protein
MTTPQTYLPHYASGKRKKRQTGSTTSIITSTVSEAESKILSEVTQNRRNEIYEYLKLFGYKPDRTIIQVHIAGFFNRKKASQREAEKRMATSKKYGGTTFVVVGRTHDPSIIDNVVKPRKKNPLDMSPGYVGYLWKNKDNQKRAPHEIIPLDFTPVHLPYPEDWKNMLATKGFMLALHVPTSLAKDKNKLTRVLYRVGKSGIDVKKEWTFLNDIRHIIYPQTESKHDQHTRESLAGQTVVEDPIHILKRRLAKGEISKEEYEELRKAIEP